MNPEGHRTGPIEPKQLEKLSDRSMPGRERHQIGDWTCRAADGVTGRANSCTPTGRSGGSVTAAVDEMEAWYLERGLRPRFQVWAGTSPEVIEELDRRDYVATEGADVLTVGLPSVAARKPLDPPGSISVSVEPGLGGLIASGISTERLTELDVSELTKFAATATAETVLQSCGAAILDGRSTGIFAMATRPEHRRGGLARLILDILLREASIRGATTAWLQVMPSNDRAVPLYRAFGFESAHAYHYRSAPDHRR